MDRTENHKITKSTIEPQHQPSSSGWLRTKSHFLRQSDKVGCGGLAWKFDSFIVLLVFYFSDPHTDLVWHEMFCDMQLARLSAVVDGSRPKPAAFVN